MHKPHGPYEKYFKRPLDFILGVLTIIAFSWLYIILVVLGIFFMRGNPFFLQERPGKNEKIFKLVKFRTMDNRKDKNGVLLPDEIRLNRYGKFLRSTSLDELPEIFNIIKGDMSIIGPRPLLVRYLPYYSTEEHHRHDVRPGLTGYAQVHGRNYVSWEEKFKMDIKYVNTISFKGDFKIITDTIKTVLKRENIETASSIVHDGVLYQPLDVERSSINKEGE
ncbi:sugar transferase [Clostridium sp. AM25-23AC]|jgi:undecaprenyl phosphate N,N'-diacetylbacillosamine 1-phosphate transferase|uniref:sugar transferase n=1 Tax=Clostridium sp. AM25-23AC TaxID=2305240 RepID=UPI000E40FE5E|nr:sugar transferase [Clostridium sp. AM25-23AC]RGD96518.1 sugar transferase [Clostridium sp. AM25-23AC]RJW85600.1 sugar transferase [Clostridiales bacterium AF36-10]